MSSLRNFRTRTISTIALMGMAIFICSVVDAHANTFVPDSDAEFGFLEVPVNIFQHLDELNPRPLSNAGQVFSDLPEPDQTTVCYFGMRGQFTVSESCNIGDVVTTCGESSEVVCTVGAKGECTAKEGDFALYLVRKITDGKTCPGNFPN